MLRIARWDEIFENNRSREIRELHWVPIPNRHDGSKYAELMAHPDGPAHFAAWILMVQIASRCGNAAGRCGLLRRGDGSAHTSASLAFVTRCPEKVFADAIERLLGLGWLENDGKQPIPHEPAAIPQEAAVRPHEPAAEGKGTEGKGIEEKQMFEVDSDAFICARDFDQYFLAKWAPNSKRADSAKLQKWAKDFDGIIRIDGRSFEDVASLLQWLDVQKPRNGSDFVWRQHVLSPSKLRIRWNEGKFDAAGFMAARGAQHG